MQVHHFGCREVEQVRKIAGKSRDLRGFDFCARIAKLDLNRVVADERGFLLFAQPEANHLSVGVVGVGVRARASRTMSQDDPREPAVFTTKAARHSVIGHGLDIIGMGADAKMCRSCEGGFCGKPRVRDEDVRGLALEREMRG